MLKMISKTKIKENQNRVHSNIYQLLIDIQIAITNLQDWCSNWCISINSMKTSYMVFYDKKNKAPPVQIPITIDGNCLRKVSSQRVLGIIIDEEPSFTPQIENITKKSKQLYNRLTCFPDTSLNLAAQIYKSFIRSKLEYGATIWR